MAEAEKIQLEILKPRYPIGQVIYIPENNRVITTKILGYQVYIMQEGSDLMGIVSNKYHIPEFVSVRSGEEADLVDRVAEQEFYVDQDKATRASRFLTVHVDDETWKLAIGDREITNEDSPYFTRNSELPPCCASLSEARDILLYCKKNVGLIVHYRDVLSDIIDQHEVAYQRNGPLGRIFQQLGIK